jgi:formylglycine-generating enzyme required for sulfatase activity
MQPRVARLQPRLSQRGYNSQAAMGCAERRTCRTAVVATLIVAVCAAAGAGPWSRVPRAVSRLQTRPRDPEARRVLAQAEQSIEAEARAGHLSSVRALLEAYDDLVSPLEGSEERVRGLHRSVASALVEFGTRVMPLDQRAAATSWRVAAEVDPDSDAVGRLRSLLLPPPGKSGGEVWSSPIDGAELVWQPPTRFLMGCTRGDRACSDDEKYLRWVETPGFWMERTEVTNERYGLCVRAGACAVPLDDVGYSDPKKKDLPVVGISFEQATDFARWAARRLPSEAEWERAARAQHPQSRFPWGSPRLRGRANLDGTDGADVFRGPAPVASFPKTGAGLFDLAGNVWEWCEDTYHGNMTRGPKDGSAWVTGGRGRVLRGGSWRRTLDLARVSARTWQEESYHADDVGFRTVTDSGEALSDAAVIQLADAAFPLRFELGRELDAADLDAADRRYLERRAVTWLVVEGRPWEALPRAAVLFAKDPRDPAARDLLERVESRLVDGAERTDAASLEAAVSRYRAVLGNRTVLEARMGELDRRVARALQAAGEAFQRRGDRGSANLRISLAVRLYPEDSDLQKLLQQVVPTPGALREWPGDGSEMVWVPGGHFLMGRGRGDDEADTDEQPAHTVRVHPFWMDRTEVTNATYKRCVDAGACTPPHWLGAFDDPGLANHPVVAVDWLQAREYARWAGKRLPTEAEWEYAARAGRSSRFPWGGDWQAGLANAFSEHGGDTWMGTAPVGSFVANGWGLVDMSGNVWEWVEDVYHPDYGDAPSDGRAWTQLTGGPQNRQRVLRGGSFRDFPPKLRVSQRDHASSTDWSRSTGFRCAADAR